MALMGFREPNQVRWAGVRPAHRGEQVAKYSALPLGVSIIYTVPAGKVLYLCTASLVVPAANAGFAVMSVRDALDALWFPLTVSLYAAGSYTSAAPFTAWPPLEVPAGYDVVVLTSIAFAISYAAIFGWVE